MEKSNANQNVKVEKPSKHLVIVIRCFLVFVPLLVFVIGLGHHKKMISEVFNSVISKYSYTKFFELVVLAVLIAIIRTGIIDLVYKEFIQLLHYISEKGQKAIENYKIEPNNSKSKNLVICLDFHYALKIVSLFFWLVLSVWFTALYYYKHDNKVVHVFDLSNNRILLRDPEPFKLIFSFDDGKHDIETFGKDEKETLKHLLRSLPSCIEKDSDRIELKIVAFASETKEEKEQISELILANNRVSVLRNFICDFVESKYNDSIVGKLELDLRYWNLKEYETMVKERGFLEFAEKYTDEESKHYNSTQSLNRRAEVIVLKAGSCLP